MCNNLYSILHLNDVPFLTFLIFSYISNPASSWPKWEQWRYWTTESSYKLEENMGKFFNMKARESLIMWDFSQFSCITCHTFTSIVPFCLETLITRSFILTRLVYARAPEFTSIPWNQIFLLESATRVRADNIYERCGNYLVLHQLRKYIYHLFRAPIQLEMAHHWNAKIHYCLQKYSQG